MTGQTLLVDGGISTGAVRALPRRKEWAFSMRQTTQPQRLLALLGPALFLAATAATAQAPPPVPAPQGGAFPGQYAQPPAERKFPAWPKGCARFEGDERMACLDTVASDFGGFYRYAAANAALAAPQPSDVPRRVLRRLDHRQLVEARLRRLLPRQALRQPRHRRPDHRADAAALPRRRVALQPKAVVILAGTNDIAGNAGPVTPDQVQDNLASMAELARAHGIRVVLASLLPVSDDKKDAGGQPLTRTRQRPTATIRELNAWLAAYAAKNGHVYLDYFTGHGRRRGPAARRQLNDDGLHPNARGYAVMAPLAEKAIAEALRAAGAEALTASVACAAQPRARLSGPDSGLQLPDARLEVVHTQAHGVDLAAKATTILPVLGLACFQARDCGLHQRHFGLEPGDRALLFRERGLVVLEDPSVVLEGPPVVLEGCRQVSP